MSVRRKRKEKGRVQNQKIQRKRSEPKDDDLHISRNNIKEKLHRIKFNSNEIKFSILTEKLQHDIK